MNWINLIKPSCSLKKLKRKESGSDTEQSLRPWHFNVEAFLHWRLQLCSVNIYIKKWKYFMSKISQLWMLYALLSSSLFHFIKIKSHGKPFIQDIEYLFFSELKGGGKKLWVSSINSQLIRFISWMHQYGLNFKDRI